MPDTRKLTGGVAAMLVVGGVAFIGLYLMIQKASMRFHTAEGGRISTSSPSEPVEISVPETDRHASGSDSSVTAAPSSASSNPGSPALSSPSSNPASSSRGEAFPPAPGTLGTDSSRDTGASSSRASLAAVGKGNGASTTDEERAHGGDPAAVAPATAADSGDQPLDLSLDEPSLVKFLDVRRKMFEVFGPNRKEFAILDEDLGEMKLESKKAMQRLAYFFPLNKAKKDGLAATGLSDQEYTRIAKVVYENWWRATASGVNIEQKVTEERKRLARIEDELAKPRLPHNKIHHLSARRTLSMDEVGRLEWARSYPARQLLAKIPQTTQRVCEKHAKEIDDFAMKEMGLLTF